LKKGRNSGILTSTVAAILLVALFRFNVTARVGEHYLIVNYMALLFIPMLYIFLVARDEPERFGFCLGNSMRALWPTLFIFGALLVLLLPASRMPHFRMSYPLERGHTATLPDFVFYEVRWGLYFFCLEFFYRGFLLFGLSRFIGWWAVIVQALAFTAIHYGKIPIEVAASLPAGIILGMLALRSKSFLPCFLLHWAVAVTLDVLVIWGR
jgi:uncharacterized protein